MASHLENDSRVIVAVLNTTNEKNKETYDVKRNECFNFICLLCNHKLYSTVVAGFEIENESRYSEELDLHDAHNFEYWVKRYLSLQENIAVVL